MHTERIHIIGAGGHAKVVVDALLRSGRSMEQLSVYSEDPAQKGQSLLGVPIHMLDERIHAGAVFHVAIGNNKARGRLHQTLQSRGAHPLTIIHPSAMISLDCAVGGGSFVGAGAIIGPCARIQASCIINHGAIVDHDSIVDDFSHVAPGSVLAGGVNVRRFVLVGAGAVILPGCTIGDNAIIGAAAMVNVDIEPNAVYVGVPAQRLR